MRRHTVTTLGQRAAGMALAALIATQAPIAPAGAAEPVEVVFAWTNEEQTFVVPEGVTSIHVVLIGGRGGAGLGGAAGGFGARVEGTLAVTPGTTLYVEVAGNGTNAQPTGPGFGRFNGGGTGGDPTSNDPPSPGGGGGGASDVRTVARNSAGTLESRLIVAGGGGGGGGGEAGTGGTGGAAGEAGGSSQDGAAGGQPGGSTAGGQGGGGSAGPGTLGLGGDGAASPLAGGGGGGGGYYGGGGGGAIVTQGGGGGGGSSYLGEATGGSIGPNTSASTSITITYTPVDPAPPDTGVVDAEVSVPSSAACIELSTTAISFGTQRFGTQDVLGTPSITVTNCSGVDENLLARGTDAAGTGAAWQLDDGIGTCAAETLGLDEFHLKLRRPADEVDDITSLSTANKHVAELGPTDSTSLDALLDMPCPGSSGAGQTMGMQIVFVVTELE